MKSFFACLGKWHKPRKGYSFQEIEFQMFFSSGSSSWDAKNRGWSVLSPTSSSWLLIVPAHSLGRLSAEFTRVDQVPGWLAGSTGFRRANSQAGFYLDPERSQARVDRVPGRPARLVRVSKLCLQCFKLGSYFDWC